MDKDITNVKTAIKMNNEKYPKVGTGLKSYRKIIEPEAKSMIP
jgi:hypothetical protein